MPFSLDQFLTVFGRYNAAVWPLQYYLYALAAIAIAAVFRGTRGSARIASLTLAALWLWSGVAYHLMFFRAINPAATVFGAAFVVQAGIFTWLAFAARDRLSFSIRKHAPHAAAIGLAAYALGVYPLLGRTLGHAYPYAPTFGVPCPTTIFTFAILLFASPPRPLVALVIPVLWAAVATLAALQLGMLEDLGLTAAAIITLFTEWVERSRLRRSIAPPAPAAAD